MENNYAITTVLLAILIALPNVSTIPVCLFNQSDVVPRRVILLNQGYHEHIQIENATIHICLLQPQEYVSPFFRTLSYSVNAVRFTGNVSLIGYESKNYELNIKKLKSVREHFRKSETGRCSLSFIETEQIDDEVHPEVENAIVRLTESCIRSAFCYPDINEIDKDADLIFESVQSSLNEIIDYIVPKITPQNFRSTDFVTDLDYKVMEIVLTLITFHSFSVSNLSTIRRLRDFVIFSHESNKFTVSGMFRFNDMSFSFIKSVPFLGRSIHSLFSNSFTINATFEFELNFNSCIGKVVFLDFMYADDSTTGDAVTDIALKIAILDRANELAAGSIFDCEDHVNEAISRILPFI